MKIANISFFTLLIFALFGLICTVVLVHELWHSHQYKDMADGWEICVMRFTHNYTDPDANGYYLPKLKANMTDAYLDDKRNVEFDAYSISLIPILIFLIVFVIVVWNWLEGNNLIKHFKFVEDVSKINNNI